MEVGLLGPLVVEEQGVSVVPSAHKPRKVLALLALHADRIVTVPMLMEEVWGEAMPRSATTTLQTYILQIRRMIDAALRNDPNRQAKDVLVTHHGGYLLQVQPSWSDVVEFNRLVDAGRRAFELGDDRSASHLLASGLELWRGAALVDIQAGRLLELEVLGLEETRMSALELRIEADLRLGRHSELVSELRVLTSRYPMQENLCMQLMLALYRAGKSLRALEAFHVLRRTLIEELGIEPSARVQRLQQAILCGDPSIEAPAGPTAERIAV
jgi:DNA-binding SARP family transcriptional activator